MQDLWALAHRVSLPWASGLMGRAGRQWAEVDSAGALGTAGGCLWVLLLSMATVVTLMLVLGTVLAPVGIRDRAMVSGRSSPGSVSVLQDPGPCSVPVPALSASGASGLGSQLVPAEPSTNHCLSPALPVSTELSQGCARGCDLCSEFNGCLRCSPKLFILLERNDIRQIGICLPSCPLGYFGLRNTDMNKCISECGAGRERARAGGSVLQGSMCLCSGAGGAVAVQKGRGRAKHGSHLPDKNPAQHRVGMLWTWDLARPLGSFVIWAARLAMVSFGRGEILSGI